MAKTKSNCEITSSAVRRIRGELRKKFGHDHEKFEIRANPAFRAVSVNWKTYNYGRGWEAAVEAVGKPLVGPDGLWMSQATAEESQEGGNDGKTNTIET